jgi:hypothetical protein
MDRACCLYLLSPRTVTERGLTIHSSRRLRRGLTQALGGEDALWSPFVMWSFPGSLLWLPTAINLVIVAEILRLSWERFKGTGNTAQGELGPFMHIIVISIPIAITILLGWIILAVLHAKVLPHSHGTLNPGVVVLALSNVAAPALLWFALLSLT